MVQIRKNAALLGKSLIWSLIVITGSACSAPPHYVRARHYAAETDLRYRDNESDSDYRAARNYGNSIIRTAKRQVGIRYRFGGKTPYQGFDCSGLVWYTHKQNGISVPRNSLRQMQQSEPVHLSRIRPGDLLFFDLGTRKVSHVAIYIGNRRFIHAPSSGKHVKYASLDNPYWRKHLVAAGRYY
jgi:cell wall-associated NlpC family hydrolase